LGHFSRMFAKWHWFFHFQHLLSLFSHSGAGGWVVGPGGGEVGA